MADNTDGDADFTDKFMKLKQSVMGVELKVEDKVACDTFDQQINYLKALINKASKDSSKNSESAVKMIMPEAPSIGSREVNKISENATKIDQIEKSLLEL